MTNSSRPDLVGRRRVLRAASATALGLGLALGLPTASAQEVMPLQQPAQEALNVELIVLHGTNDGKGIDPNVGDMPELKSPPFSSYNSYKLLQKDKLALALGKSDKRKLPNDRNLLVTFKGKKDQKYTVSVNIQKPNGPDYLPLLDVNGLKGQRFFVAGQAFKGGILVIGVKLLP